MVVKSLKPVFILFSKTVLFFYIRTDLLYQYCFPVFVPIDRGKRARKMYHFEIRS